MFLRQLVSRRSKGTSIVMMNMGGPETTDDVGNFLHSLFSDKDIISFGRFQKPLARWIAWRRTPHVAKLYAEIGGGSPIRRLTEAQGRKAMALLDELRPESAPHRFYVAFRYVKPGAKEALQAMLDDAPSDCEISTKNRIDERNERNERNACVQEESACQRAVAFSQYPQFSCTTTGSSLNELWRQVRSMGVQHRFQWSLIDRWPLHEAFVDAVVARIDEALASFGGNVSPGGVHLVFSAHSLPLRTVLKGDHYPGEVAATVHAVMHRFVQRHGERDAPPYQLAWQSQVGPQPWLGPQTDHVIEALAKRGARNVLVVPIAFTTDHIETLSEIDRDFALVAKRAGIQQFRRAPALNDSETSVRALAHVIRDHLDQRVPHSHRYLEKCPSCSNDECRQIVNPIV
jgi:protoporphyrin/coproporphyrin ferrochelatase